MPAYDARIRSLVDVEAIKAAGFTVLVDNMWGNGAGYLSRFIAGGDDEGRSSFTPSATRSSRR